MDGPGLCFPLLGVLFAIVRRQGSQRRARRSGSAGELLSGLIVVAIVAGAFARAGSQHGFSCRFNRDNQTSKRV